MPNWDRSCTNCGFTGSYLDFRAKTGGDATFPDDQVCDRLEGCGETVTYREGDDP